VIPLPLRDNLPHRGWPAVTLGIIVVNALVWVLQLGHGVNLSVLDYGLIPAWLLGGLRDGPLIVQGIGQVWLHQEVPVPLTLVTSMFMHASWLHLIGNLWFLWIFGDSVEAAMGPVKFALFYLACGLAAATAQVLSATGSTVPVVGASGAIAGVLGAYALLYPRARVRCLWILIIFVTFVDVRAWLLLGFWFVSQLLLPGPGVAWVAHVGGFLTGLALVALFAARGPRRTPPVPWEPRYGS